MIPLAVRGGHLPEEFQFVQGPPGAFRDGAEGVLGDVDRESGFLGQQFVEAHFLRAAAETRCLGSV